MERLTRKYCINNEEHIRVEGADFNTAISKLNRLEDLMEKYAIESIDYLEQCIKRSDKYGELEEEIGCPIEVRCKITNDLSIYDKEGNRWIISQIEETYIDAYSSKDNYYTMIFPYKDYQKSWWLKEDRSE